LRSKFLLSLALVIAAMTWGTLFVVRQSMQAQVQTQMEEDARNSLLTFQVMAQQKQMVLSRKAELLATLAFMRNGDPSTIQEASQDPWQSEECDLFALADRKGKITALQAQATDLPTASANRAIGNLVKDGSTGGWWVSGEHVYQLVVKPYYQDPPINRILLGAAIVGREIDTAKIKDLARILSSEVTLRYGTGTVISSMGPFDERDASDQIGAGAESQRVRIGRREYWTSSVELTPGTQPPLSLTVLKSDEEALKTLSRLNRLLLGLGFIAVMSGAILVFVISDTFTRPLNSLVQGVRALERGNFAYPLEATGNDEVAQVTLAFENMRRTLESNEAKREQLEGQLRQAQKMDALGRLAGGVAHDFNNLLTVIKGNSDLALDRLKPADPVYGSCQQIKKVADRAAHLTRQLLAFSRKQLLQPKILDLNELIAEMGRLLNRLLREDIEFVVRLGESLARVQADPGQIEQVLLNLTVNASDAMPQGGKLTIETKNVRADEQYSREHAPLEPGAYVMLAVTDSGHGMDSNTKARIFEPFFTTKEPGKGTGLGLATVYGVVKQSSGFIWVDSSPGNGARFEIYLPQVQEKVNATSTVKIEKALARGKETVLVVEDEDDVRTLACGFLKSAGYRVLSARDGEEALEIGERVGRAIHLLITDVVMPQMRGPELARRLKDHFPDLKVVYMSGYPEEMDDPTRLLEEGSFLQKPFSCDALLRQIDGALRARFSGQAATVST
jgi:signal transduction histidine kinase/ActR/RegA family two-component response regulator